MRRKPGVFSTHITQPSSHVSKPRCQFSGVTSSCLSRKLHGLARAVLRDKAEAEDALQEAYLLAFQSIGKFRGDASLSTWLSRLVLNECFGRVRRHTRRDNMISMVSATPEVTRSCVDDSESPEASLARAQVRNVLERRVDELPDAFRT